jgi:RHS repeat-associated protein
VARVTQYSTGTVRTQFMHRDHLGSIDTITDESGAVVARMSFDAHGTRRLASGTGVWNTPLSYSSSVALLDGLRDKTTRGFTDHEMLDGVGVIHMNGRVYDPKLGRFLSVDPVFQFPTNTQSLNPYTYVLNTPLSMTDPTGLEGEGACTGEDADACGASSSGSDATLTVNVKSSMGIMMHADSVSGVQLSNGSSTGEGSKKGTSNKGGAKAPESINAPADAKEESTPRSSDEEDHFGGGLGRPLQAASTPQPAGTTKAEDLVATTADVKDILEMAKQVHAPRASREAYITQDQDGKRSAATSEGCGEQKCSIPKEALKGVRIVVHRQVKGDMGGDDTAAREYPGAGDADLPRMGILNAFTTPGGAVRVIEVVDGVPQVRTLSGGNERLNSYISSNYPSHLRGKVYDDAILDAVRKY